MAYNLSLALLSLRPGHEAALKYVDTQQQGRRVQVKHDA